MDQYEAAFFYNDFRDLFEELQNLELSETSELTNPREEILT